MKIENLFSQVQYTRIAITQETEVVAQGVIVDSAPIATDKSADEQQECGLRLVEIGDELIHDMERVSGFDHDLCRGMERILPRRIKVVEDGLQGFFG